MTFQSEFKQNLKLMVLVGGGFLSVVFITGVLTATFGLAGLAAGLLIGMIGEAALFAYLDTKIRSEYSETD